MAERGITDTLGELFRRYDLHVTCRNPHCWRNGGRLDPEAFLARYGPDYPVDDIVRRVRCSKCGGPGAVSIVCTVNSLGERVEDVTWPRIAPPPPRG